jgi:hypothetical protein
VQFEHRGYRQAEHNEEKVHRKPHKISAAITTGHLEEHSEINVTSDVENKVALSS